MKTKLYAFVTTLLLIATACGSDSADGNYNQAADEELVDAQIETYTKETIDSIARATNEGNILHPVPDTLTNLLQQYQPKAKLATLTDQAMANKTMQVDNPVYLRGHFDGNNSADYAVQVLQNDSVRIIAFLDYTKKVRPLQVASYPAQLLNSERYSEYQLKLAPKDSIVSDPRDQKQIPLPADGISVLHDNRTTMYVLKNGRFIPFDAKQ